MSALIISLALAALALLYFYSTRNYNYWQKQGVPCANGAVPGVGNLASVVGLKNSLSDYFRKLYNDNKGRSMVGFYNFMTPSLLVLEPELVKTVLQTSFTSFHKNTFKADPNVDPLLVNNPFFSYGDKWLIGRKRLTYAFSSMRLKILLESVKVVCDKFLIFLDNKLSKAEKVELELKELFSRYTAQVVAGAGFGVDGFSFENDSRQQSFYDIGNSFFNPNFFANFMITVIFFVPWLGKILKRGLLPKDANRFFRSLVTDVMEKRRTETVPRNDFLQLMVELEKMEGDKFDLEVLASHAVSFFVDGFETSSVALSFVGFQLAAHPEVQEKLRQEVDSVLARHDGAITYEALREMTYMDQVISESQRVVPVVGFLGKVCTDECDLRGSDGLVCHVKPGVEVIIPVHSMQEDPQYWDNPEVFDPERFNAARKHSIEKFTFLPFGEGPRICVGMRMALLQIKACLAVLLRKYRLELSPRTQLPLKMMPSAFLSTPIGGLWVFIRPIQSQ